MIALRRRPHRARHWFYLLPAFLLAGCTGLTSPFRPAPPPPSPAPAPPSAPAPAPPEPFDLIIAGGTVYDGTGNPPRRADVGIRGDRIAAVGDLAGATAGRRIDATGQAVAPGFIDVHAHTYEYEDPYTLAALRQGITTQIGGVDGRHHGFAAGGLPERPRRIADALAALEKRGTGVNQALFAGLGTIRSQVMGFRAARPTAEELARMQALLAEAMAEGALGLSSGLDYDPDRHATTEEVIALARVAARAGGIYATHVRGDYRDVRPGVAEALRIGQEAGIPVAIQHFKFVGPGQWGEFNPVLNMIGQARARGQSVSIDLYPYQAPDWATRMTVAAALAVAGDPALVEIDVAPRAPGLVGRTLAAVARERGAEPGALARQLSAEGVRATPVLIKLEQILALLQLDYALTDSDGEAAPRLDPDRALLPGGQGVHPRSYGSYPRFLRLNREHNLMPLAALIRKLSGAAADFYQLSDRGYLRPGAFADLVVFDPDQVRERATFAAPQENPEGIHYVLVNGQVAVDAGQPTQVLAGRALRRGGCPCGADGRSGR